MNKSPQVKKDRYEEEEKLEFFYPLMVNLLGITIRNQKGIKLFSRHILKREFPLKKINCSGNYNGNSSFRMSSGAKENGKKLF